MKLCFRRSDTDKAIIIVPGIGTWAALQICFNFGNTNVQKAAQKRKAGKKYRPAFK